MKATAREAIIIGTAISNGVVTTRYTMYIGLMFPLNCILLLHRVYVLSIRNLNHHLYSSLKIVQLSS